VVYPLSRVPPPALYPLLSARQLGVLRGPTCQHPEVSERQKDKSHKLDTAPLTEGTSLQKRSGMARVVEGFKVLPAHLRVYPRME